MARDLSAVSRAFILLALFNCIPGYVFGWLWRVFDFRNRSIRARLAISVPLSVAVFPVLTFLLWRWSLAAVWIVYGAGAVTFLALLIYERHMWLAARGSARATWAVLAIAVAWLVLSLLCLIDLQIGRRLYFSTIAYDYTLRTAITSAVSRNGIPPMNPYFFPGHPYLLRYHYFWFMPSSLVEHLSSGISARQALFGATPWCGLALMALISLYLRFFQTGGAEAIERRTLIGIALLAVTGLDIIPVLTYEFKYRTILPTIEWWNEQVSSWIGSMLWTPHHLASLIACFTGLLLVCYAGRHEGSRASLLSALPAGLAFASGVGFSIYVALVFAVFLAIWVVLQLLWRQYFEAALLSGSGVVAAAASYPYLMDLSGGTGSAPSGSLPLLGLGLRKFAPLDALTASLWPGRSGAAELVDLLLLPLNYFLELGFFFAIGFLMLKVVNKNRSSFQGSTASGLHLVVTSVLISTFVVSLPHNDLAWRGMLPAQFILLIWATEMIEKGLLARPARDEVEKATPLNGSGRLRRATLLGLLALGVAGSVYELIKVRFYPLIADDFQIPRYSWLSPDHNLGSRTYGVRKAYEELHRRLPDNAIIQHNPDATPGDLFFGLYADHQAAAETPECGVVFGGDSRLCGPVVKSIRNLFENPDSFTRPDVDDVCAKLSIAALIAKDTDRAWADPRSWVWTRPPVTANDHARAFLCGAAP